MPSIAARLALTPISAFRPRRWRGALLPHAHGCVRDPGADKRPVSAVADDIEVRDVVAVDVRKTTASPWHAVDKARNLDERILTEQFID